MFSQQQVRTALVIAEYLGDKKKLQIIQNPGFIVIVVGQATAGMRLDQIIMTAEACTQCRSNARTEAWLRALKTRLTPQGKFVEL